MNKIENNNELKIDLFLDTQLPLTPLQPLQSLNTQWGNIEKITENVEISPSYKNNLSNYVSKFNLKFSKQIYFFLL